MSTFSGILNENLEENWNKIVQQSDGKSENSIMQRIETELHEIIKSERQLGANVWFILQCYTLPSNHYAVVLEDGHIKNYVILKYDEQANKFISIFESCTK